MSKYSIQKQTTVPEHLPFVPVTYKFTKRDGTLNGTGSKLNKRDGRKNGNGSGLEKLPSKAAPKTCEVPLYRTRFFKTTSSRYPQDLKNLLPQILLIVAAVRS